MATFDIIALDADDTLWDNEHLFIEAQQRFIKLLEHYHDAQWITDRLYQTEIRNIQHFGYGIKAFALSMIETAVELTEGRISGQDIQTLVTQAKEMLGAEVRLLDHAAEAIPLLARRHRLIVITKGELMDQESKMERSGLAPHFAQVEIVSQKTPQSYARLLKKHAVPPERFMMVGNSLRSDILPILELGGSAVYVPYENTWQHEAADIPAPGRPGFYQIEHLGQLPALLDRIEAKTP